MLQEMLSKRQLSKHLVFLISMLTLIYIFSYDLKLFLFLTYGTEAILSIAIMVIAINTYDISRNTIFTFLAISLGFCGLIQVESLLFTYYDSNIYLSEYLYLQIFKDYLTLFSLVLCSKFYNKKFNFKRVFLSYSIIVLLFTLFLFVFNLAPSIHKVIFLDFRIKDMLNFTLSLLSFYPLYTFTKIQDDLESNDLKSIFLLSIFFIFSILGYTLDYFEQLKTFSIFFSGTLMLIYTVFTCNVILKSVLKKPYKVLFHDLDKKSKEIEKSKNRYKSLVESLPMSTLIINDNKIIFVNLHALELFNYNSKSDFRDKDISTLVDNESINNFNKNYYNKNEFFETKFKTSNGNLFDAKVNQFDIIFNNTKCTLMIIKDISQKKKIAELNRMLEKKLAEENLRTEFFSNLSHELRTPINVLYSILQLEDMYIKNGDMQSIERHHKTLKQNCLRLLRICNNLIDTTKIDAGYFNPDMKCVNIVNVVENIVSSVSVYTQSSDMNITFDTEKEEIYTLCDNDLIERIILNLISNSIKYGNKGGNIWVDIYDDAHTINIIFKDDGPGIPKEQCEYMFERFIQADKSFNRSCEGSGLGLALVKSLVELHGGTITLESDEGLGCEFTIMIPKTENICSGEIATNNDNFIEESSLVDKINIEFSDIYF